eukprot:TRINITY_DN12697_c0_g3_i1.p1 TRINITY_DN12697_c0_g3~~TRINITY_DN12697_c0_g3_i1.p1  ORF type:complete len:299 (-),score=48.20 TRINITY_DN12697_c0_g3_i1:28-924(-)
MKTNSSLDLTRKNQDFWYDADKNKYFLLKNGTTTACSSLGVPLAQFVLYGTGYHRHNHSARPLSALPAKQIPLRKFTGYTQFPRPVSMDCSYAESRPFTVSTQVQFKRGSFVSGAYKSSPALKRNLLTAKQKALLVKNASNYRLQSRASTNVNKLRVNQSPLKSKNFTSITSSMQNKTYKDVVATLKWEKETMDGYKPPPEKIKRPAFNKLFEVHVTTEIEMYERQQQRRELINPKIYTELIRKEQVDRQLLIKRQQLKREKEKKLKAETAKNTIQYCIDYNLLAHACLLYTSDAADE